MTAKTHTRSSRYLDFAIKSGFRRWQNLDTVKSIFEQSKTTIIALWGHWNLFLTCTSDPSPEIMKKSPCQLSSIHTSVFCPASPTPVWSYVWCNSCNLHLSSTPYSNPWPFRKLEHSSAVESWAMHSQDLQSFTSHLDIWCSAPFADHHPIWWNRIVYCTRENRGMVIHFPEWDLLLSFVIFIKLDGG